MDFQPTEEQALLRDTTRDLLSHVYDQERRNEVADSELGFSREVWRQMAEIGILGLGFDEDSGGQIEIALVMTEIGKYLAPEPVIAAALAPGSLIAELGTEDQRGILDDVAVGQTLLAAAYVGATTATQQGDSWILSGRMNPVVAGDSADVIVVSAALPGGGNGVFLVDADATTRHPYRTFDGRRGAQIDFSDSPAQPLGEPVDATRQISDAMVRSQSALCAEAVGAMAEALRLTTEYLTTRKQFGVTLNKFQTLTQRAADMYVSLEMARSMSLYAAMSIADGNMDPVIASRAKLQIGRSGRHIGQEAIQLHGGIGMTAEYPVGHYTARLTAIEHTLGSSDHHLRALMRRLGDYEVVTL
jgi:alkylation response protein AidB-like acyl-CoA dehydrogenase